MSRLADAEQAAADRTYVEPDPRDAIIKELMEALEPFDEMSNDYPEHETTLWPNDEHDERQINIGDLRNARSALSRAKSLMEQKP